MPVIFLDPAELGVPGVKRGPRSLEDPGQLQGMIQRAHDLRRAHNAQVTDSAQLVHPHRSGDLLGMQVVRDSLASGAPLDLAAHWSGNVIERRYPGMAGVDGIPQTPYPTEAGKLYKRRLSFDVTGAGVARVKAGNKLPTWTGQFGDDLQEVVHYASVIESTVFEDSAMNNGPISNPLPRVLGGMIDGHYRAIDQRRLTGDGGTMYGILTMPGIPRYYSTVTWRQSATTGAAIVEDFGAMLVKLSETTDGVFSLGAGTRIIGSNLLVNYLKRRVYAADGGGDISLAAVLQRNYGFGPDSIMPWNKLDNAVSGYDVLVLFNPSDPGSLKSDLIQPPTQVPVEERWPMRYRYVYHTDGGLEAEQPASILIALIPRP